MHNPALRTCGRTATRSPAVGGKWTGATPRPNQQTNASDVLRQSLYSRVFSDTHLCAGENATLPVWAAVQTTGRCALYNLTAPDNCRHRGPGPNHLAPGASSDRAKQPSRSLAGLQSALSREICRLPYEAFRRYIHRLSQAPHLEQAGAA